MGLRHTLVLSLLAFLPALIPTSSFGDEKNQIPFYNEIFDESGKVRPQYEKVYEVYKTLTPGRTKEYSRKSVELFLGDQALDSIPRVLTESEMAELQKGVRQRGTALRLFLEDYYSGGKKWQKIIPPKILERIIDRSGESAYAGLIDPKKISFPYGPDIVRDHEGVWRVLEDNPGNIGGPGDIIKGREILLGEIPEYRKALDIRDNPERFFKNLISRYKTADGKEIGKIVLYTLPLNELADKEDIRIRQIFEKHGVECVFPGNKRKRLHVTANGVYLEKRTSTGLKREKVSFVIMNSDHKHLDWSHPATREAALLEEASDHVVSYRSLKMIKKRDRKQILLIEAAMKPDQATGKVDVVKLEAAINGSRWRNEYSIGVGKRAPGLIQAILDGKVNTNYMPGLDFIGDKEFNAYVDDLVRLYTGEEPILKNIPSQSFALKNAVGEDVLDNKFFDHVFKNKDRYVVKVVDGRGGEGIWVGPKVSQTEFDKAKAEIIKEPWRFRAQEFRHLSVLDDRIVDLRLISHVDDSGVLISETPWGRAISMHGDGKVNVSSNGFESPVVVVRTPQESSACLRKNIGHVLE